MARFMERERRINPPQTVLQAGDRFTLSVTVRNQGNARAPQATVYYLLEPAGEQGVILGPRDSVRSLDPSETSLQSLNWGTPASGPGTYYFSACVGLSTNQIYDCSDKLRVTVSAATTPTLPGGHTNRTHPPLRQCNDTVLISEAGGVVLPSIDTVQIPSSPGTLRMEWNAFDIPDRFVLEVDGRVAIDTQYVGDPSYTISEINRSLSANGLPLTTQAGVIPPGTGRQDVVKTSAGTSATVSVYAPLPGTKWSVRLTWVCGDETVSPPGPGQPSVLAFSVEDGCNDGSDIQYRFFEQRNGSLTGHRWPGGGRVYVTPRLGESVTTRLSCDAGTYACYGAEPRSGGASYWGSGIDGDQGCTDCCYSCPVSGERAVRKRLTCG